MLNGKTITIQWLAGQGNVKVSAVKERGKATFDPDSLSQVKRKLDHIFACVFYDISF